MVICVDHQLSLCILAHMHASVLVHLTSSPLKHVRKNYAGDVRPFSVSDRNGLDNNVPVEG